MDRLIQNQANHCSDVSSAILRHPLVVIYSFCATFTYRYYGRETLERKDFSPPTNPHHSYQNLSSHLHPRIHSPPPHPPNPTMKLSPTSPAPSHTNAQEPSMHNLTSVLMSSLRNHPHQPRDTYHQPHPLPTLHPSHLTTTLSRARKVGFHNSPGGIGAYPSQHHSRPTTNPNPSPQ